MKYILKSEVPFCVGASGKFSKRAVFESSPGFLLIHHLPIRNKAFSEYYLDCENPCCELCRRTEFPGEIRIEISPVPLNLPPVTVAEKTFEAGSVRCFVKLVRQANCYTVSLDSPDYCESYICSPLSAKVSLEVCDVGIPLVCILEDDAVLTVFTCVGDFRRLFTSRCSNFCFIDKKILFRRHYEDSRKRFEDVCISAKEGQLVHERTSFGFSSRKKTFSELAPLYFLECLAEGFDEEAREYLDASLAGSDLSVMREFFGSYSQVRLVGERFAVESGGKLKFYFFELENGKISNFRE